jgi:hypothetical protein
MSELVVQTQEVAEVECADDATTTVVLRRNQRGMVSAEWAVGLIAAVAIAGVLIGVVTNGAVKGGILKFILLVIASFSDHMV